MTPDQIEHLNKVPGMDYSIGAMPGEDRTLLYGYTTERATWHVYQQGGLLHKVIYIGSNPGFEFTEVAEKIDARHPIPNKRLYPEACDFIFCWEVKRRDVHLPFTNFGGTKVDPNKQFHGRIM